VDSNSGPGFRYRSEEGSSVGGIHQLAQGTGSGQPVV